jgi:hypothetical protein
MKPKSCRKEKVPDSSDHRSPEQDDEMLYMKACPRCHGDVELGSDMYGAYLACLQCGYIIDSREEALTALKLVGQNTQAA